MATIRIPVALAASAALVSLTSQAAGQSTVVESWNSWDADFTNQVLTGTSETEATLLVYEAFMADIATRHGPITYRGGGHPHNNNQGIDDWVGVRQFWGGASENGLYGYWGRSTGSWASPIGDGAQVFDNGVHPPPESNRLIVLRFTVPTTGNYTVDLFGAKRKPTACGDETDVSLWNNAGNRLVNIADVRQSSVLPTVAANNRVYPLGTLQVGQYIYFGAHHSNDHGCDNNWIRYRVNRLAVPTTTTTTTTTATTTTVTATTQTILARLQGNMNRVEQLLEQQIAALTARVDQLAAQNAGLQSSLSDAQQTLAATAAENTELRGMLTDLTGSLQAIGRSNDGLELPAGECTAASGSSPRVEANGWDLAVESCSGTISLSSQECTVDPCDMARRLQQVQAKVHALGAL